MKLNFKIVLLVFSAIGCAKEDVINKTNSYELVFRDDFDTFDNLKWNTSYWFGNTNVNNNEDQWYIKEAFEITNGILKIKAEYNPQFYYVDRNSTTLDDGILNYTSGIITTHKKVSFIYGKVNVRCKLPSGQGVWPALWLLPSSENWPPEIDILESIGDEDLHFNLHYWDIQNKTIGKSLTVNGIYDSFNIYTLEWTPEKIAWSLNGLEVFNINKNIPNEAMYFIANLAIGGNWPGYPNDTSQFPKYLEIDYIEIFQYIK